MLVTMCTYSNFFQSSYKDLSSFRSPSDDSNYAPQSVSRAQSHSKTPSTVSGPSSVDPNKAYTAHLITHLNIPSELIDHSDTSLYMAYRKYKAIVAAIHAALEITWRSRSQQIPR